MELIPVLALIPILAVLGYLGWRVRTLEVQLGEFRTHTERRFSERMTLNGYVTHATFAELEKSALAKVDKSVLFQEEYLEFVQGEIDQVRTALDGRCRQHRWRVMATADTAGSVERVYGCLDCRAREIRREVN